MINQVSEVAMVNPFPSCPQMPNPLYPIILLSHPFSTPPLLLISSSPITPYISLHHVFGMTCHLNSAPFLYLHHNHCQSQNIIFIRLLYLSTPGFPLKTKISSLQITLTLTHLIIHPHNLALNDTHLNSKP